MAADEEEALEVEEVLCGVESLDVLFRRPPSLLLAAAAEVEATAEAGALELEGFGDCVLANLISSVAADVDGDEDSAAIFSADRDLCTEGEAVPETESLMEVEEGEMPPPLLDL